MPENSNKSIKPAELQPNPEQQLIDIRKKRAEQQLSFRNRRNKNIAGLNKLLTATINHAIDSSTRENKNENMNNIINEIIDYYKNCEDCISDDIKSKLAILKGTIGTIKESEIKIINKSTKNKLKYYQDGILKLN